MEAMRTSNGFKKEVESRLKKYLSRDNTGIRRALLKQFLKVKSATIKEIFDDLKDHFPISYQSVASMVGIIASRIGILHVKRNKDNELCVYELKEQYLDLVVKMVGS
jgi:uncharacterized protein YlxP (DUF503 family)